MADTSIIGRLITPKFEQPSPIAQYGQIAQLQNLIQGRELQGLQIEQARKAAADDAAVSEAYKTGGDENAILERLMSAGQHKAAQTLRQQMLQAQEKQSTISKNKAQAGKAEIEAAMQKAGQVGSMLDVAAKNPAAWGTVRGLLLQINPNPEQPVPEQYDPNWISAMQAKGQTITQRLEQAHRDATLAETQRHNRVTEGNAGPRPVYDPARGGFADPRTNTLTPVTAPGGGQIPAIPDAKLREDVDSLRKEFETRPSVKQFRDTIPITQAARNAPDTRAGDIQMAYAVGKVLDPDSVVREGELKLVGNAATLPEKIKGEIRTLVMGKGRMTPETRKEIQAMIDSAVSQRQAAYDAEKQTYGGIIQRRGYNPEDIFMGVADTGIKPKVPAVGTREGGYVFKGGDPSNQANWERSR